MDNTWSSNLITVTKLVNQILRHLASFPFLKAEFHQDVLESLYDIHMIKVRFTKGEME